MDAGFMQGTLEKCVFGGLLLSTVFAWWRQTIGKGGAQEEDAPPSYLANGFANLSLVALLSFRWYDSGHFPLSNMYESLMFLTWGLTAATLYFASPKKTSQAAGLGQAPSAASDLVMTASSPVALAIVAFATLSLPKELQKASALVPALQSNWLVMHVSVVMCSYATLMFGSTLCAALLFLQLPKENPLSGVSQAVMPAFRGIVDGLAPAPAPVPTVATAAVGMQMPSDVESRGSSFYSDVEEAAARERAPSPVAVSAGGSVTMTFSQGGAQAAAPASDEERLLQGLDDLSYRSLLLGFGFLTIGIISGAVWANEAWGNYWSWDPKETWALITWLVYAGYLHTRLQLKWEARKSAMLGAFGFLVTWVCYIGVNLMGIGLHSYGFFLK